MYREAFYDRHHRLLFMILVFRKMENFESVMAIRDALSETRKKYPIGNWEPIM